MRHVLRLNVAGPGFVLVVLEDETVMSVQAVESTSDAVSAETLAVVNRLDDLVDEDGSRPFLHVRRAAGRPLLAVTYALRLPVRDEHDRGPMTFVHEVVCPAHAGEDCLRAVAMALTRERLEPIVVALQRLAMGRAGLPEVAPLLTRPFTDLKSDRARPRASKPSGPVVSVCHDCDARTLGWLAVYRDHRYREPPWSFHDRLDDRQVITGPGIGARGPQLPLSSLITSCLDHSDVVASGRVLTVVSRQAQLTPHRRGQPPTVTQPPTAPRPEQWPLGATTVRFAGWWNDAQGGIVLTTDRKQFCLSVHNILSVHATPTWFAFVVKRSMFKIFHATRVLLLSRPDDDATIVIHTVFDPIIQA